LDEAVQKEIEEMVFQIENSHDVSDLTRLVGNTLHRTGR